MKQISILRFIFCWFIGAISVNVNAFQVTYPDNYGNQGGGSQGQKFIIIIDVMGIGTNMTPSFANVCPGNTGTTVVSGNTIPLSKATAEMEQCEAVKLGFRTLPNAFNFVEFHSWIDCSDNIVLADVHLWGGVKQTILKNASGEVTEVQFFMPGTPFQVRIIPVPGGGGIKAVTTGAKGVACTDHYPNPCFITFGQRSDQLEDAVPAQTTTSLQAIPNPFVNAFEAVLNLDIDSEVKISLMDMTGREVRFLSMAGTEGVNQFTIDGEDLASGMYFLAVRTAQQQMIERVVKKE